MKFDIHVHTILSSCSQLRLEEIIGNARVRGLDGVCITDHHTMGVLRQVKEGMQPNGLCLIAGMEYATADGDFLVFGPFRDLSPGLTAVEMLQRVDGAGGAAVAAHPFRDGRRTSREIIAGHHCRIMEGRNGRDNGNGHKRALAWRESYDVRLVGGSDAHSLSELGGDVTVFDRRISTREEFIGALREGRYHPQSNRGAIQDMPLSC